MNKGEIMLGLFSERNKSKNVDEVIIFDKLPEKLRIQLMYIVEDLLNKYNGSYKIIHKIICEEHGKLSLHHYNELGYKDKQSVLEAILNENYDINLIFDIIELSFKYRLIQLNHLSTEKVNEILEPYFHKLNCRFKESSVGYKMVNYEIIRIDSQATFTEIIEPTINLTNNKIFENVNNEYIEAIKAYQNEDNEKCLIKCLKSFESTLKIICKKKRWKYSDRDTSKRLLDICYEKELIPTKMQSEFTSLRSLLESGIGPVRNHYAGHGKGGEKVIVEDYIARYALNITGSCIVLLIEVSEL